MAVPHERVKLLLMTPGEEAVGRSKRGRKIGQGASNVMSNWPNYLTSAVWCIVFVISVITLLCLLVFLLLIREDSRFHIQMPTAQPSFSATATTVQKRWGAATNEPDVATPSAETMPRAAKSGLAKLLPRTRFDKEEDNCREINRHNGSLLMVVVDSAHQKDAEALTSEANVFYFVNGSVSDEAACAMESVLRLSPDKNVYLFQMDTREWLLSSKCEANQKCPLMTLKHKYSNFNMKPVDPVKFLESSQFAGHWNGNDKELSLYAAKLVTVWQLGGTAISTNLLMYSGRMYANHSSFCEVDRDVLYSPEPCHSYVYSLMQATLKKMRSWRKGSDDSPNDSTTLQEVVDTSLHEYCGAGADPAVGCHGVNRLKNSMMCDMEHHGCFFIRMDQWMAKQSNWKEGAKFLCPEIFDASNGFNTDSKK